MIRTGVLSYGMSGRVFHCPFLHEHPAFEFVAICERTQKKANLDYPNIKSYNTVHDLINDASIDLVVINTPNNTHYEFGIQALRAGKHILVEKPFTTTVEKAKALFEEGRKQNKKVFVYQNRRFDRDFAIIKQMLENEKLGKIHEAHLRFDRFKADIGSKKFKEEPQAGSGIIYDLGPHLLDQAIVLFGLPTSWTVQKNYLRKDTKVEDFAMICLHYNSPLSVMITLSMQTVGNPPAYVLHGDKASLFKNRSDVQESQLIQGMTPLDQRFAEEKTSNYAVLSTKHPALIDNIEIHMPSPKCSYMEYFDAVADSLQNDSPFLIKEEEILKQIEILASTLN